MGRFPLQRWERWWDGTKRGNRAGAGLRRRRRRRCCNLDGHWNWKENEWNVEEGVKWGDSVESGPREQLTWLSSLWSPFPVVGPHCHSCCLSTRLSSRPAASPWNPPVILWLFALKILFIAITRICAKMPAMSRCRYTKCNCREKRMRSDGMNPFCLQRNKRIMI